jgi:hypothetical protein
MSLKKNADLLSWTEQYNRRAEFAELLKSILLSGREDWPIQRIRVS